MPTAGILLAAGRSSRMGGRSKLLRDFRGKPLVRWMAEALIEAGLEPVVAVFGSEPAELRRILGDLPVRFVENPRFFEGMATSLAAGVAALSPEVTSAVVALGDMPLVRPNVVKELIRAFENSGKTIAVPVHEGRRGHPVVFDLLRHREALLNLCGDEGARAILAACPEEVLELPTVDPAVLLDVDTAEDLRSLQTTAQKRAPRGTRHDP